MIPARRGLSRLSFGAPAGVAAAAAAAFVLIAVEASAQPPPPTPTPPSLFAICLDADAVGRVVDPSHADYDPVFDPRFRDPKSFSSPDEVLELAIGCSLAFSAATVVPMGMQILTGLAIILVVWTGVGVMFAGIDPMRLLSMIMLIGFAFMVMQGFTPDGNIWGQLTFPELIYQQGNEVAARILDGSWDRLRGRAHGFFGAVAAVAEEDGGISKWRTMLGGIGGAAIGGIAAKILAAGVIAVLGTVGIMATITVGLAITAGIIVGSIWGLILGATRDFGAALFLAVNTLWILFLLYMLIWPLLFLYVTYLWGYIGVMAAIILGPLFVPWMLFPQTDWLFWSWLRCLIKLSVHFMIASILFVIAVELAMFPFLRVTSFLVEGGGRDGGTIDPGALFGTMVPMVPVYVLLYTMLGKTGEMVDMVTEGAAVPDSGGMGVTGGLAGGLARGAAAVAGSVGGVVAGGIGGLAKLMKG